jgi:hypothetical protein
VLWEQMTEGPHAGCDFSEEDTSARVLKYMWKSTMHRIGTGILGITTACVSPPPTHSEEKHGTECYQNEFSKTED